MAKFINHDYSQMKLLAVSFDRQILPGTFEHTLHHLVENKLGLSLFDQRYENEDSGRPAFSPAMLLSPPRLFFLKLFSLKKLPVYRDAA